MRISGQRRVLRSFNDGAQVEEDKRKLLQSVRKYRHFDDTQPYKMLDDMRDLCTLALLQLLSDDTVNAWRFYNSKSS